MVGSDRSNAVRGTCTLVGAVLLAAAVPIGAIAGSAPDALAKTKPKPKPVASFQLVRSQAAANAGCLSAAQGSVRIFELGFAERMEVSLSGLPAQTAFDLFIIQVPDAPFGLSWYQGDVTTDKQGSATESFVGRLNEETFIVAPGAAPAPIVHPGRDAATNPATEPVHTAHLGLWFNSPADAGEAGCGATVTPFNGDHDAGVQVLSTRNFGATDGPLLAIGS